MYEIEMKDIHLGNLAYFNVYNGQMVGYGTVVTKEELMVVIKVQSINKGQEDTILGKEWPFHISWITQVDGANPKIASDLTQFLEEVF